MKHESHLIGVILAGLALATAYVLGHTLVLLLQGVPK